MEAETWAKSPQELRSKTKPNPKVCIDAFEKNFKSTIFLISEKVTHNQKDQLSLCETETNTKNFCIT